MRSSFFPIAGIVTGAIVGLAAFVVWHDRQMDEIHTRMDVAQLALEGNQIGIMQLLHRFDRADAPIPDVATLAAVYGVSNEPAPFSRARPTEGSPWVMRDRGRAAVVKVLDGTDMTEICPAVVRWMDMARREGMWTEGGTTDTFFCSDADGRPAAAEDAVALTRRFG